MNTVETYDVVVIGGGPVGENVAGRAVQGGLSAVLVESELYGGECSYWACMPSKALLRPEQARAAAAAVPGVSVAEGLDVRAVLDRRDAFTSGWDDAGQVKWATDAGIAILRGHGRITGEREVTVGDQVVRAERAVVVCTGSVPVQPPIDGLDTVEVWGSREATSAQQIPRSLAILGGGVIGVEMAQAYASLGAEVTLIVAGERLLERMEPIAGDLVLDGLRDAGVTVHRNTSLQRVEPGINLVLDNGSTFQAEKLLVAVGRRPASADIGIETVGIEPGKPVTVDDSGEVSGTGWLYAAGDVTGRAPLTHQGKYQARIVADVIVARAAGRTVDDSPWSQYVATADHAAVPQVVFSHPEVAAVGRTAAEAERAGIAHRVVDLDLAVAGSSLHADGYTGKVRMIVDTEREVLLGVTFVGPDVAELLHAATIAVVGEVPLRRLWHAVPAYPTISEIWLRLLESYGL